MRCKPASGILRVTKTLGLEAIQSSHGNWCYRLAVADCIALSGKLVAVDRFRHQMPPIALALFKELQLSTNATSSLSAHARAIWQAAVDAVHPEKLLHAAYKDPSLSLQEVLSQADRILVVGAGKAGAAMSAALEDILAAALPRIQGIVN